MPAGPSSQLSPRIFGALFAALLALAAAPLLAGGILPLVDYPNHLARMVLLARLPHDAALRQFYETAWAPLPNLAMDAVVPPLLAVMPAEIAGRVFVLLTFALLAGGPALVHRALWGRWSAWPLLAFLLLYGRLLLWGVLNFLFGLGLGFCALAAMIALRGKGVALRLVVGLVLASAIYFAHLMAFGVYAVLLVGIEAAGLRRDPRRIAARILVAILPLIVPLAAMLAAPAGAGGAVAFSQPLRKLDLLFSVFDLYHRPFDIACFALAIGGMGLAFWRRWLVLAPDLALPLALLALVYLALPTQMMGASGVDRRLPLVLALTICAGAQWMAPRPRLERAFLAAAAVMFLLRLGTVAESWSESAAEYRPVVAAFASLPAGSRIAVAAPPEAVNVSATPLVHLPVLLGVERDGFVPTLFAISGQQPVAFAPAYRTLAAATSPDRIWRAFTSGARPDDAISALLRRYDYVVFVGTRPFALDGAPGLVAVAAAPRVRLFRVAD